MAFQTRHDIYFDKCRITYRPQTTSEELNTGGLNHKNDIVIDAVKRMHVYTLRSEATIHIHHVEIDH